MHNHPHNMKSAVALFFVASGAALFLGTGLPVVIPAETNESGSVEVPAKTEIVPSAEANTEARQDNAPARIAIPSINVDAMVQHVGINSKGNMVVPGDFEDVGWYRYGSVPGESGNAVFAGHVDNGLSLAGVFKKLNKVAVGDVINVTNAAGETTEFEVTETESYPLAEVPQTEIFSKDGAPQIVLITCEGTWLPEKRTYDHRRVVFASPK